MGDDSRPVAIVHAMERALPGLRLEWTVSDDHQLRQLPQRDVWLTHAMRNGGFPLVCNNDAHHPVMISGLAVSASSGAGGQPLLDVHAKVPLDAGGIEAASSLLEGIAESARAFWGQATPFEAGVDISRQTRDPMHKPGVPPRGLPALKLPEYLRSPEIPYHLGWLNYWSAPDLRAFPGDWRALAAVTGVPLTLALEGARCQTRARSGRARCRARRAAPPR